MKKRYVINAVSMISLALVLILLFVSFSVFAQTEELPNVKSSVLSCNKIDPTLYETAKQKDGKYLVCILNESIPSDTLHDTIKKETRFDVSLYETDKFNSCVVPELEREYDRCF